MGEINIFDTPGKTPTRGALARSLSAVASSPQQEGTTLSLNNDKKFGEGGGGVSVGVRDWAEEVANEEVMEGVSAADGSITPTPTAC
jgi:hypothetical protein